MITKYARYNNVQLVNRLHSWTDIWEKDRFDPAQRSSFCQGVSLIIFLFHLKQALLLPLNCVTKSSYGWQCSRARQSRDPPSQALLKRPRGPNTSEPWLDCKRFHGIRNEKVFPGEKISLYFLAYSFHIPWFLWLFVWVTKLKYNNTFYVWKFFSTKSQVCLWYLILSVSEIY